MDYEQTREQIIKLATQPNAMARPTPMDLGKVDQVPQSGDEQPRSVDDTWWGMDAVGKGYGKGQLKCYACGEYGHFARDCVWDKKKMGDQEGKGGYKGGGRGGYKGGGKGGYKGKGKGEKGKGKGKGFQGNCHNCGKFGHTASECYAPKRVPSVEGDLRETNSVDISRVWDLGSVEVEWEIW
jgi:hypothetical protein